jgi:hypothetical protein
VSGRRLRRRRRTGQERVRGAAELLSAVGADAAVELRLWAQAAQAAESRPHALAQGLGGGEFQGPALRSWVGRGQARGASAHAEHGAHVTRDRSLRVLSVD